MTKSRDLGNLVKTGAVQFPDGLGTEGQTLQVNSGENGLEFADVAAGMTVYTGMEGTDGTPSEAKYLLNVTSPENGDQAFVSSNNTIFVRSPSGWRKVATVQESPSAITGASASYNVTSTTTDITLSSTDPEGFDVTWSYAVGGAGTLSGSNIVDSNNVTLSTISVQTAAANSSGVNTITYRITPVTTSVDGSYTITFTGTDTQSTSAAQTSAIPFTISFFNPAVINTVVQENVYAQSNLSITTIALGRYSVGQGSEGNSTYSFYASGAGKNPSSGGKYYFISRKSAGGSNNTGLHTGSSWWSPGQFWTNNHGPNGDWHATLINFDNSSAELIRISDGVSRGTTSFTTSGISTFYPGAIVHQPTSSPVSMYMEIYFDEDVLSENSLSYTPPTGYSIWEAN
jgi:hypothetical protein